MIQVRKERIAGSEQALVMSFLLMVLIVTSLLVTARPAAAASGSAQDWGWNFYGQLGDGTDTDSNTPVQVNNLGDVKSVAAGCYHSLTLKQDGTVWAWGLNDDGQLGDGSYTERSRAVKVKTASGGTLGGVKAISAGGSHSLAVKQ